MATETNKTLELSTEAKAYNGVDRNAWILGWNPQQELARVYSDRLQQSYYLLILEGSEEEIHRAEPILRDRGIEYWGIYDSPQASNCGVN
ncbi:hypothetical protein [Nostoc favosum]|uniref:Uncharacterized protein n=1 Tax=Nostoc favosum CHAB5714 TaxID=2780399 RepID=A0ABS8IC42_9NOSO|nr:hypothetical protein [Nostoc favosum]MCC5601765.1 hypothetical protein [Nostoc favosum CHAB5714]